MVWVAQVRRDASVPLDQVHVALYGYFPQIAKGDPRPNVWRLLDVSTILLASRLRPSTLGAVEVTARHGVTYDFRATIKRERNVGGSYTRPNGTRRKRDPHTVEMTDHDEIKARIVRCAEAHGGDVRYVRAEGLRHYQPAKGVRLPICDVIGKVYVRDPEAFDRMLCAGGPGTGKAYGLGLWYLPEIMGGGLNAAA